MSLDGRLDVTVDRRSVEFAFTVQNADTEPVELSFRSGLVADVAVFEDGTEVWRWSEGRAFTQALGGERLEPGESFVHTVTWEDPRSGEYTAVATLQARNNDLTARAEFSV